MRDESIAAKTIKGSFFSIGSSAITIVSGFVRSVILARLLLPEDFGVIALAMFFLSITNQIGSFGLNQALIHRDADIQEASSTHFVLRVSLALVVMLLTLLVAPLLTRLYPSQPQMVSALIALSFLGIINAVNSTPSVLLLKELKFKYVAVLDVASSLAMTIGAPAMALAGFGFWSLVGEQAIAILVWTIGLWRILRPWQFSLKFNKEIAKWYFHFGSSVFASSGLTFLLDQFDDFWIGTALGSAALGFYSRAYEFARYPRRIIAGPIMKVFFPAYAKLQHDRLRLSKAYYRATSLIVRMGFLFSLVFVLVAPEFIRIFIGAKWLPMVFTFRLMIFYALLDPLVVTSGHLITAVGQPQILTRIKAFQLLIFVPAVVILARYFGINGVAVAVDLMLVTGVVLILAQVRKYVDFSVWKMFRYPTIGLLLSGGVALLIGQRLPAENDFLSLTLKGSVAAVIYGGLLLLLERNEYMKNLRTVYNLIRPGV